MATSAVDKTPKRTGAGESRFLRSAPAVPPTRKRDPEITRVLGISVPVAVVLAERDLPIESILGITVGTILEFDVAFGSELILMVGNRPIGRGAAVKVGEHFGLRITTIGTVQDRIGAMGGH